MSNSRVNREDGIRTRLAANGRPNLRGLALRLARTPALCAAVVVSAVLFVSTLVAATDSLANQYESARRLAFVVGNGDYQNFDSLANPRRDAGAVGDALERIGFDVTRVMDGDGQVMNSALSNFIEEARESDIVLFYFAGHSVQVNGENYLLPITVDASEPASILEQSLSLGHVRNLLNAADPGLAIVILDSCRDNPLGPMATERTGETAAPLVFGRGLAQTTGAAGMLIAYATQPGELAYDGEGDHSPFTESLLRYVEDPGLEIRLMFGRVREDVVVSTEGAQVPWVEEAVLGEFYFSDPVAGDAKLAVAEADHDLIFWRSIWRSEDATDFAAYLQQFPDGTYAALATNRLAALSAGHGSEGVLHTASASADALSEEDWRLAKNSLYWLGYYSGPLTGAVDHSVHDSVQAFQAARYEQTSGLLTGPQLHHLHDAAADSLISLGERLAERIVFDAARLDSIDRGITDIALPAYQQLVEKLADSEHGEAILMDAKAQIDHMQARRDNLVVSFESTSRQYFTVVTAAGAGYREQVADARYSEVRAGGTEDAPRQYLSSQRQVFLQHALDYAQKGEINEQLWLEDLR